jgi:hypothetical protein
MHAVPDLHKSHATICSAGKQPGTATMTPSIAMHPCLLRWKVDHGTVAVPCSLTRTVLCFWCSSSAPHSCSSPNPPLAARNEASQRLFHPALRSPAFERRLALANCLTRLFPRAMEGRAEEWGLIARFQPLAALPPALPSCLFPEQYDTTSWKSDEWQHGLRWAA